MFSHCNRKFQPFEIWFLKDSEEFKNRKFKLGICPNERCQKGLAELEQTRKDTEEVTRQFFYKKQVEEITSQVIKEVKYASTDVNKKKTPFGLRYGVNKEIKNKKGEIVGIRQYASDFYGRTELIKTV